MAFPDIPSGTRILTGNAVAASGTRTFPSLSSLTKNAGDLLIAICVAYQSSAGAGAPGGTVFSAWGASFTEFCDQMTTNSSTMAIGAAYKWSTGAETGTFTVTQVATVTGGASMLLLSIPNAHPSQVPEVGTIANGTGAANPTVVTASWGSEDNLFIAVGANGETAITGSWTGLASAPTNYVGYTDTAAADTSTVGECEGAVAFRKLTAASDDPGAFTGDTSNTRDSALIMVVRAPVVTYTRSFQKSFPPGREMPRKTLIEALTDAVSAGGATTPQALTATVTTTATFIRSVGKFLTATVTSTASIVKRVNKSLTATATSTATIVRSVGKPITATVTSTASILAQKVKLLTLSATVTSTATIVKSVGKPLQATVTSTASVVKSVGKPLTATVTSTASLLAQKVKLLTISATVTSTATIVRSVGKPLSATITSTASIVKRVNKAVTATVTSTASMTQIKVILKTITATVTSSATMVRQIGKPLSATATVTASIVKSTAKRLTATVTSIATLSASRAFLRTLSATVTSTATITRQVSKALTATVTTLPTLVKSVGKGLVATVTSTASIVADPIIAGAIQVLGYFGIRPRGMTRSRPAENEYAPDAGEGASSSPDSNPFDPPSPGGEMD